LQAEIVAIILSMACATFLTRFLLMALLGNARISKGMADVMRFVPIAVLTSLIVPSLLAPKGYVDFSFTNEYLVAGIVATIVTHRTKVLILTIVVGIATILAMRLFIS
jgi:branched-subunit amino acid transport protein